tara:strand:- start:113 stop:328 length:216 start_codon:yes stop_codon:yes gene_type:complete
MFNIFHYSGEKMTTVNEIFKFLDKVDDLGEIHVTKTPSVINNVFQIGLREASIIFEAWVDIKKIETRHSCS